MEITQRIIARNLRLLMRHNKIRQSQASREIGVSKQTISNILNPHEHKSIISVLVLLKLSVYFKVPAFYFFFPDMTVELLLDNGINELVNNYIQLDDEGMYKIRTLAKIEVQFKNSPEQENRMRERRSEVKERRTRAQRTSGL